MNQNPLKKICTNLYMLLLRNMKMRKTGKMKIAIEIDWYMGGIQNSKIREVKDIDIDPKEIDNYGILEK